MASTASGAALRFSSFDVTRQAFFRSKLTMGIVNLRPIVDRHVLVIPRRVAPRLADLTAEEVSDLFLSVQTIGSRIERETGAQSLTVAVQDGPYAGQSVPHVHVHVLPRKKGDFEPMDDVYNELENVDLDADQRGASRKPKAEKIKMDSERKDRTHEEMEKEARWLASLFPDFQ